MPESPSTNVSACPLRELSTLLHVNEIWNIWAGAAGMVNMAPIAVVSTFCDTDYNDQMTVSVPLTVCTTCNALDDLPNRTL